MFVLSCTRSLTLAASRLPTVNTGDYEISCFVRWLAMANTPSGGIMSDYDVLNIGWRAPQLVPPRLTTLMGHIPAVVLGSRTEYQRAADLFRDFVVPSPPPQPASAAAAPPARPRAFSRKGRTHVSDQAILRHAIMERRMFDKARVAFAYRSKGSEDAPLLHFSHLAVGHRGAGKNRNELMAGVLASMSDAEEVEGVGAGKGAYPRVCGHALSAWPARVPLAFRAAVCGANITGRHCYDSRNGERTCLPGFVGIGFEKAATRKMFDLLQLHPAVCGASSSARRAGARGGQRRPPTLEDEANWPDALHISFGLALNKTRAAAWPGKAAACLHGEWLARYAAPARPRQALATIRNAQQLLPPSTLFLAMVRDPVARAYSHYRSTLAAGEGCAEAREYPNAPCFTKLANGSATFRHAVCYALEQLGGGSYLERLAAEPPAYPFREVSRKLQHPHWDLISPGFYAAMLRPWASALGSERFWVGEAEEVEREPARALAAALDFLRLPPLPLDPTRNASLYSLSVNSYQVAAALSSGGGVVVGPGGQRAVSGMEDDPKLIAFLTALYTNSSRTTNQLWNTRLPSPPFAWRDLALHEEICGSVAGPPPAVRGIVRNAAAPEPGVGAPAAAPADAPAAAPPDDADAVSS